VSYLVDTNVLSEVRKPRADAHVAQWFASVEATELYVSVLALGEIRQGIARILRRDPARAAAYERWVETLGRSYGDRVLPIDAEVAEVWGPLNVPDPLPVLDGLMVATALVHDLTLVTRNVADIASTNVSLLNPFDPLPPRGYATR
jgi:predicted nucleic acid-binding protein